MNTRELADEMASILSEMVLSEKIVRQIVEKYNSDTMVAVTRFNRLVKQVETISAEMVEKHRGSNDEAVLDQLDAWLTSTPSPIYASDYEMQLPERSAQDELPVINLLRTLEPIL